MKLKKAALFTDIHFGKKNNSELHNKDCVAFIDWFYDKCLEYDVDHIDFAGDWFEERDSIDSLTAKYAMDCAVKLNSLGIPIFFIVGNHDLYYRDNRAVYATYEYKNLENFIIIDEPYVSEDTLKPTLYSPFLFEKEYPRLAEYLDIPIWIGHFEFKGFVITGETITKKDGPDPDNYSAPDIIMSGHFHKRQKYKNIHYIGNTFPMNFSDANDNDRGMALYDYESGEIQYVNWEDCPKYLDLKLSQIIENPKILKKDARVKCSADVDISHSQHSDLKNALIDKFSLRELNINDTTEVVVEESEFTEEEIQTESTTNLVVKLLGNIESETIDNKKLIKMFLEL